MASLLIDGIGELVSCDPAYRVGVPLASTLLLGGETVTSDG
jgi:hypothetical protein